VTEASATAEVQVSVDPAAAFAAFTEEIDSWWVRGPINFFDAARAVGMKIEPGVDGRVLETYEGDVLELGRITVWEPGSRLTYRSSVDDTEVDVRFEEVASDGNVAILLFPREGERAGGDMPWVYVDDLDAHFAHAESEGADIVQGIHQHGYRAYVVEDVEGRRWTFAQARPTMQAG